MFNTHFPHYQTQNTPIQNTYFHQFNRALSHLPHPSPLSLHFLSAKSPLLSPEISPQSNISSRFTSLTPNHDHDHNDDDSESQAPLLSPGNFFKSFDESDEEESPCSIEDFPQEKSPELPSNIMKKSKKITKQTRKTKKREVFQVVKTEKAKTRKRNPWSSEEDAKVMDYIKIHGTKWSNIAKLIEGRSGKQVRDRYLNVLMPNIKRTDWTEDEDEIISRLFVEIGPQWCKISDSLKGRTEAQVKNRYYTYLKKMSEGKIVVTRPKKNQKVLKEEEVSQEENWLYQENEEKKVMETDVISFEDYINFGGETVAFLEEESIFL
jgi:hypothetical protein